MVYNELIKYQNMSFSSLKRKDITQLRSFSVNRTALWRNTEALCVFCTLTERRHAMDNKYKSKEFKAKERKATMLLAVCVSLFFVAVMLMTSSGNDLSGVLGVVLSVGVFFPICSVIFSMLIEGKAKLAMSVIAPLILTVTYVVLGGHIIVGLGVFVWCEFWSLLGTMKGKKKGKKQTDNSEVHNG